MRYRSTIVYLAAAALLVGIYVYDLHKGRKTEKAEESAKALVRLSENALEQVTLTKDGVSITIGKTAGAEVGKWEIISPIRAKAEDFVVEGLQKAIAELKYERIMAESAEDLAQFGLDPPTFVLSYKTKEGSGTISFGTETPIEYGTYTRLNEERKIYLVETPKMKALDKSLFDLRDKDLFTLSVDKVQRLALEQNKEKWTLIKKGGRWVFKGDQDFPLDQKRVDALVVEILSVRVASFEKASGRKLKDFGLDRPKARITLAGNEKSETLRLGRPTRKATDRIYAKMDQRSEVVTVDGSLLTDLPKDRQAVKEEKKEKKEKSTD